MPRLAEKTTKNQKVGGKLYALNMRTTFELRRQLEAAAAESGNSLAREVEARLERSFLTEGLGRQLAQQGNLLAKIATRLGVDDAANLAPEPVAISGAGSMTVSATVFTRDEVESREDRGRIECFIALSELISLLKKFESGQEHAATLSRVRLLWDEIMIAWKTANFAALSEKLHALTRNSQNVEAKS